MGPSEGPGSCYEVICFETGPVIRDFPPRIARLQYEYKERKNIGNRENRYYTVVLL